MVVREACFPNAIAMNTWIGLNEGFIQVLETNGVVDEWTYETSARLQRPRIVVKYLDYRYVENRDF